MLVKVNQIRKAGVIEPEARSLLKAVHSTESFVVRTKSMELITVARRAKDLVSPPEN